MAGSVRDLFSTIESFMTDKTARARRTTDASDAYTAADIEVLEGLEPVRRRPGMYIGGTDEKAMHHLFAEVIDNSMDEAVAGHATWIEVEFDKEGFLSRHRQRARHARSIRIRSSRTRARSKSSCARCTRAASSTARRTIPRAVCTASACRWSTRCRSVCEVEVARGQQLYRMEFSRGEPQTQAQKLGPVMNRRGTKVRFKPDEKIFGKGCAFKPARLLKMARSKAYLFGGVEIRWTCDPSLITDDTPTKRRSASPAASRTT